MSPKADIVRSISHVSEMVPTPDVP